jgi:hypothetical protein
MVLWGQIFYFQILNEGERLLYFTIFHHSLRWNKWLMSALRIYGVSVWTGFMWLVMRSYNGLPTWSLFSSQLLTWQRSFMFHKWQGISWNTLASTTFSILTLLDCISQLHSLHDLFAAVVRLCWCGFINVLFYNVGIGYEDWSASWEYWKNELWNEDI